MGKRDFLGPLRFLAIFASRPAGERECERERMGGRERETEREWEREIFFAVLGGLCVQACWGAGM